MSSLEELQSEKQSILEELKGSIKALAGLHSEREETLECLNDLVKSIGLLVSADEKVAMAIKETVTEELKQAVFGVERLKKDVGDLQEAFNSALQSSFEPLLNKLNVIAEESSSELKNAYSSASNDINTMRTDLTRNAENAQVAIKSKSEEFETFLESKSSDLHEYLLKIEDRLDPLVDKSLSIAEGLAKSIESINSSSSKLHEEDSQLRKDLSVLVRQVVREEVQSQLEVVVMNSRQISEGIEELKNKKTGLLGGILK